MMKAFSPIKIGDLEIRNKFVHSATYECMAIYENGFVTDEIIRRYRRLSKGKIGLIIPGHMYVHPVGKAHHGQIGIYSDELIPGLRKLTDAVHEHGGKIAFQLNHAGGQANKKITGHAPLAPIGWGVNPVSLNKYMKISEDQIQEVIGAFADAARRAADAGADAVQLHCAHGYLLNEFLSPFYNTRKDAWGGSDEHRFLIIREIIKACQKLIPEKMPIIVKLNIHDYTPKKGITPELAAIYADWLVKSGVAAVEISCGTYYSFHTSRGKIPFDEILGGLPGWMRPIGRLKMEKMVGLCAFQEAFNLDAARIIKPVLDGRPLILVGGIRRLSQIEELLQEDEVDMISLSRPFIREPFLVKKFMEGKTDASSCVSCNKCVYSLFQKGPLRCRQVGAEELNS